MTEYDDEPSPAEYGVGVAVLILFFWWLATI